MKKIDITNEDPEYWEKILEEENLSMERGSFGNPEQRSAIIIYLRNKEELD
jgi:hypothetical protein